MLELLAEGRTAEVFAYGEGRVLKLDRPDWNGLSDFEGTLLADLADAGLPVARPHGTVHRRGAQRPDPRPGRRAFAPGGAARARARRRPSVSPSASPRCSCRCNATVDRGPARPGAPAPARDRGQRARRGVARRAAGAAGASSTTAATGVCHFDFHPLQRADRAGRLGRDRLAHRGGGAAGGRPRPHARPVGALVDRAGGHLPARRPPGRHGHPRARRRPRSTPGSASPPGRAWPRASRVRRRRGCRGWRAARCGCSPESARQA